MNVYGTVQSDHIPVAVNIDIQLAPDIDHGAVNNIGNKIDWSALSEDVIYEYGVPGYTVRHTPEILLSYQLTFYCVKAAIVLK